MSPRTEPSVWSRHAAQWALVGPPLRPCSADSELMSKALAAALPRELARSRIGVLGVTPEIVRLPVLAHAQLVACDHNASMVAALWDPATPAARAGRHLGCIARWQQMPVAPGTLDAVLGDGSLTALPSAEDARDVLAAAQRALKPGGLLVLRCFIRPETSERPEDVVAAAWHGAIEGFDAFKWRLVMSLADVRSGSVAVRDAAHGFDRLVGDRDELRRRSGWSEEKLATLDAYRHAATRYYFPTEPALAAMLAAGFDQLEFQRPGYELGERCPTVTARSRAGSC